MLRCPSLFGSDFLCIRTPFPKLKLILGRQGLTQAAVHHHWPFSKMFLNATGMVVCQERSGVGHLVGEDDRSINSCQER